MKLEHGKATRRNGMDLRMPKARTESGKRGIYYSGTKIFSDWPLHLKAEKYYIHFKKLEGTFHRLTFVHWTNFC